MLNKTAINAAFKPLSDGLLKEGRPLVRAVIGGWPVEGRRLYNAPGSLVSWSPTYAVGFSNNGKDGTGGPRDHCVAWIHANQR